jgi:hypothetical protein
MTRSKDPRKSAVRWSDLPHERLSSEIARTVAYRLPQEAHYDLRIRELSERLPELHEEDHREYVRLISAEINRDLRICRDTYRTYLATLNNKSRTEKGRVALNFAVAPRASQILRREICAYLRATKLEPWIVEIFLAHNVGVLVPLGNMEVQTPREPSIEEFIRSCVPNSEFQNLKKRFKRESFIVGGRFAKPHVLRCAISYGVNGDDLPMLYELYDANEIWISQAGRMWDNVLHEIVAQEVQIDLEERSDAMAAVEVLSLFDRCAGPLYAEAGERYTTIPDVVWADMGAKIDRAGTSLEETLEPEGKKVLRDLARQKIFISTWEEALVCDSDFGVLESKIIVRGNVKYRGMLSRHAKRAFYRARDKYRKVLEHVYEKRIRV